MEVNLMKDKDITLEKILSCVDHTLLAQTATWDEIKEILDDAIKYNCASACIPPSFVKRAKGYVGDRLAICTVIGFPNGYSTSAVKAFEVKDAIASGADEIDMVINIGDLKDKKYEDILNEIKLIKAVCGDKLLKVIIETCLLTDEEKIKMCQLVSEAKADFIKTSTGFSKFGATREDIKLFSENIDSSVKMKASGGISSMEDAIDYINLGCERLGTSRIVKLVKTNE
jgi:deoxyribose-phosphate aldolase